MEQHSKKRVWIVDDDENFCHSLKNILEANTDYDVIGNSLNLTKAYKDLQNNQPDMVTVDLSLPDGTGVELIKWLELNMPECHKIVVSFWGQDDLVFDAFTNGADGYLQKDHLLTMEIGKALTAIETGGTQISPKLAKKFLSYFQNNAAAVAPAKNDTVVAENTELSDFQLSKRERLVLKKLTQGLNYAEIAEELSISYNTVSTHIKRIYKKLNVTSKTEAVLTAMRHDWF